MVAKGREASFAALLAFLEAEPLTATIAALEHDLEGRGERDVRRVLRRHGISVDVLQAALVVREHFGRVNDVIHATAIALALPHLLAPNEQMKRPSLAAGNDPSRPFDVETNLRVAEFKLARWDGHDAMRKRQVFKDLVHLAADTSGRSAELYVLGVRPVQFLHRTKARAAWALDRAPATRALFEKRFGSLDIRIPDFVDGRGAHVTVVNLEQRLPKLFAVMQPEHPR
jgi:hypothetical protein